MGVGDGVGKGATALSTTSSSSPSATFAIFGMFCFRDNSSGLFEVESTFRDLRDFTEVAIAHSLDVFDSDVSITMFQAIDEVSCMLSGYIFLCIRSTNMSSSLF